MKTTTYKLNIENPCKKSSWNEMTISDKSRFCSLCDKKVFDFMNWTDEEVINFLNNSEDNICAKLSLQQINRIIKVKEKFKIYNWQKIAASILLVTSVNTFATNKQTELTEQFQLIESKYSFKSNSKISKIASNDTIKQIIKGKLIDEESQDPIQNIRIEIKGTQIKSVTDSLGIFEIIIPDNFTNNEIVLLVADSYGFEGPTEKIIFRNELPITNLIIEKPGVLIGEVIYYKPKKWWQFWKRR